LIDIDRLSGTQKFGEMHGPVFDMRRVHMHNIELSGYPDYYRKLKNALLDSKTGLTRCEILKICHRNMDIESLFNAVEPGILVWCDEKYPPRYHMCDWVEDD